MKSTELKAFLEGLYVTYNRRELVYPDPLVFLYDYDDPSDREIAGLVSSCLAYGRVAQILKSVQKILSPMGSRPHRFLLRRASDLRGLFGDFRHRFTTGEHMAALLERTSDVLRAHGTLEAFMGDCLQKGGNLMEGLNRFARGLEPKHAKLPPTIQTQGDKAHSAPDAYPSDCQGKTGRMRPERLQFSLLSAPENGSACKRLLLWLKWMVRHDDVDPGGWSILLPRDLLMPTDTHIHNIALRLGLTQRRQADLKTVVEITRGFADLAPEDPTRYDFALSRFGIRTGLSVETLMELAGQRPDL
ncbi:MAG: TIGR02757 family protein [Synergistaceae bacterium]|nr:TIGR02757 family protein [Synergistaceae bacterium]